MAAFIIRTVTGTTAAPAGPATPNFADVPPNHSQYGYIEDLDDREVTTGCNTQGTTQYYCPNRPVTRAEMAVFVVHAYPAR